MFRVNAKIFLLIIELTLFFLSLAVFFFFMYRKQSRKKCALKRKNEAMLSKLENFSDNLEKKFKHIRDINARLQAITSSFTTDSGKAEEYKQLMAEFEKSNKEFDICIAVLKKENTANG